MTADKRRVQYSAKKLNNIDTLRLVFAVQVLLVHVFSHLNGYNLPMIEHIPGVPAFFFISGFLIYGSYLKSPSTSEYWINRFLRLFPGLCFVTIGALLVSLAAKGGGFFLQNIGTYVIWLVSQLTIGQAYNPVEFEDIGVGVLNGALWTISVEILFYVSVPILVALERRISWIAFLLLLLSFAIYTFGDALLTFNFFGHPFLDFLKLTPIYWGWMFLFGIVSFKYFDALYPLIKRFWTGAVVMALIALVESDSVLLNAAGNQLGLFYFIPYAMMILFLAFGVPKLSLKADLSFGIYIWHMVIINALLIAGLPSVLLALLLTILLAGISWYLIERPALALKRYSFRAN